MPQTSAPLPRHILDAHHHFWDRDAAHYPWLSEPHDFFVGDYAAPRVSGSDRRRAGAGECARCG